MPTCPPANDTFKLVEVSSSQGPLMVPCQFVRSARSRHIRIYLNVKNDVVVSLPKRCSWKEAYAFLKSQGDFLSQAIDEAPVPVSLVNHLSEHPYISAFGNRYRVALEFTSLKPTVTFFRESDTVCLRYNPAAPEEPQMLTLLRQLANDTLVPYTRELAEKLSLPIRRVSIRNQVTRWGSCSSGKAISLNWRLILLKPVWQDYIIYHELAHLTEMNHSSRFWRLLEHYDPHAQRHDADITAQAATIIRLGRV